MRFLTTKLLSPPISPYAVCQRVRNQTETCKKKGQSAELRQRCLSLCFPRLPDWWVWHRFDYRPTSRKAPSATFPAKKKNLRRFALSPLFLLLLRLLLHLHFFDCRRSSFPSFPVTESGISRALHLYHSLLSLSLSRRMIFGSDRCQIPLRHWNHASWMNA